MKLSDGEKLIAFMLADIMEAGGIEGDIDPSFVKTIIASDSLWALKWKYHGLFHGEGADEDTVQETASFMTMCRVVENSIANLPQDERATIPEHEQKVFVGFDGNEEPHYGVAVTLVEQLDRFNEWAERGLNSHHNTVGRYRRMKNTFDRLPRGHSGLLDLAGIRAVLQGGEPLEFVLDDGED